MFKYGYFGMLLIPITTSACDSPGFMENGFNFLQLLPYTILIGLFVVVAVLFVKKRNIKDLKERENLLKKHIKKY